MLRALWILGLLTACVVAALWLRRAAAAWNEEVRELQFSTPAVSLPIGDDAVPGMRAGLGSHALLCLQRAGHGVAVDELDTRAAARALRGHPLRVLVGERDNATPPAMAEAIAHEAGGAAWWSIRGAKHADMPHDRRLDYQARIVQFFERYLGRG